MRQGVNIIQSLSGHPIYPFPIGTLIPGLVTILFGSIIDGFSLFQFTLTKYSQMLLYIFYTSIYYAVLS